MSGVTLFFGICAVVSFVKPTTVNAETREEWFQNGRSAVTRSKAMEPNESRARSVILFVGYGMGISTVTASRILEGQMLGSSGEENQLSFDQISLCCPFQDL
jgi:alkaline phosphatase